MYNIYYLLYRINYTSIYDFDFQKIKDYTEFEYSQILVSPHIRFTQNIINNNFNILGVLLIMTPDIKI